jgi:hypothetical protein
VKYLLNGKTVAQVPVDQVTYYHVELERHDVVLSEGLPTESYLDTGDREKFSGAGVRISLYPDFSSPLYPDLSSLIWEAKGCAPLVVTGPAILAARKLLELNVTNRKPKRAAKDATKASQKSASKGTECSLSSRRSTRRHAG